MGLNQPPTGLRRIGNTTKSVAKAAIAVQPGDELTVPSDVADQLVAARVGLVDMDAAPPAKAESPSAEEAAQAVEAAAAEDPGAVTVPADLATIEDVIAWVGNDPARASAALAALLKQAGFNVDVQTMDWASLVTRRTRKEPADKGGWNVFVTYWGGADASSPVTYSPLTANGDQGYFGWPVDPEIETLKTQFIETADAVKRKDIAARIERRALEAGVLGPIGEGKGPAVVRRGVISGLLPAAAVVYWNVQKK